MSTSMQPQPKLPDAKLRVMYIEDDADLRALVELIFEREPDLQVFCYEPSSEVDLLARMHAFRPDLVLLDVMMPCMDGLAVAQTMLADAVLSTIPFVFMTAKARPQELAELKKTGALGIISKPFDALQLPQTLRNLWHARESGPVW